MVNEILEDLFKLAFKDLDLPVDNLHIINSNRPDLCDYQFDGLFKLAHLKSTNPEILGNLIIENIKKIPNSEQTIKDISFVKPGFINITLTDAFINNNLILMQEHPKFNLKIPKTDKYIIDYGGYNIAKPLHIGHLRPTIIGESIKRIIKYFNNEVIADVHVGDFGLQMGQVIYGILRDNKTIESIDIDYLNKIYPEISALCKSDDLINQKCAEITKSLQDGDATYVAYWQKIMAVSLEDIKKLTNYLDIHFDLWEGESDAFKYFKDLEDLLNAKHLLKISEGASVIEVKNENDNKPMPPMIFKKSNGAYLYDSTDLATIYERKLKFNPDHIIYVTDFRQNLHFEQVFRASDIAGIIPYKSLEHAYNGTINGPDNKPFKTRKGDAPKLAELISLVRETFLNLKESNKDMDPKDIDIIVNAIIKFADLQNSREKDYIFDVVKFSDVVGKTGPYILYSYVRTNKILKQYDITNYHLSHKIYNQSDRNLR